MFWFYEMVCSMHLFVHNNLNCEPIKKTDRIQDKVLIGKLFKKHYFQKLLFYKGNMKN